MTEHPSEGAGPPSRPAAHPPAAGVSGPDASTPRRASGPRRVRNGLRLRARDGRVAPGPLSDAVMGLLAEVIPAGEMTEGIEYARLGQIVSLQIDPAGATALVQGRAIEPYRVWLGIGAYTDDDWKRVIDAMAGEAIYLVKLLANELPEGLGTLLASLGLVMLPSRGSALTLECSCGSGGRCRHVAAAGCVLAEMLQVDPMLVFTVLWLPAGSLL